MIKSKSTQAIHGRKDKTYRGANYPIYQSTTFAVEKSDDYDKYISGDEEEFYMYTRYSNPTVRNVEEKIAALENAEDAILFSSGMAAITTVILSFVENGSTVVAQRRLYGMAYRFLRDIAPKFGIQVQFVDESQLYTFSEDFLQARIVYFETPINPTTDCVSISKTVKAARKIGALTIMDNTFASPINQNPIDFGVDVVIHSATKYIGGHSDIMAGAAASTKGRVRAIRETMKAFGGCINPIDAYMLDRSLKTLKVRVEQQNRGAQRLAEFFMRQKKVKAVFYPGLPGSKNYKIARRQMKGFGGMLCVELVNLESAKKFCDNLEIALNATSLGGTDTLVSIPVLTSHIKMKPEELNAAKVTEGMVRISVGIEDVDDLIQDFKNALARI
ncbi:MAG TPA: aminotransferase class I/II-fold pyridoxal phosphate-dependent enzyme [Candidatus Acidoferrales bacterium]|nr:aminotransferase class I/II-fold pyridoxal phosphate-dependent enzyme [Candidatus Acidoferrales bacterium]